MLEFIVNAIIVLLAMLLLGYVAWLVWMIWEDTRNHVQEKKGPQTAPQVVDEYEQWVISEARRLYQMQELRSSERERSMTLKECEQEIAQLDDSVRRQSLKSLEWHEAILGRLNGVEKVNMALDRKLQDHMVAESNRPDIFGKYKAVTDDAVRSLRMQLGVEVANNAARCEKIKALENSNTVLADRLLYLERWRDGFAVMPEDFKVTTLDRVKALEQSVSDLRRRAEVDEVVVDNAQRRRLELEKRVCEIAKGNTESHQTIRERLRKIEWRLGMMQTEPPEGNEEVLTMQPPSDHKERFPSMAELINKSEPAPQKPGPSDEQIFDKFKWLVAVTGYSPREAVNGTARSFGMGHAEIAVALRRHMGII